MNMDEALRARAMNERRDKQGHLICPHISCKTVIRAITGLDELQKLQKHFNRKHK